MKYLNLTSMLNEIFKPNFMVNKILEPKPRGKQNIRIKIAQ